MTQKYGIAGAVEGCGDLVRRIYRVTQERLVACTQWNGSRHSILLGGGGGQARFTAKNIQSDRIKMIKMRGLRGRRVSVVFGKVLCLFFWSVILYQEFSFDTYPAAVRGV